MTEHRKRWAVVKVGNTVEENSFLKGQDKSWKSEAVG